MPAAIKLNLKRRRATTLVGLDIQPGYVAAVQARVNGSIEVEHAAGAPLPADTVREGEVLNVEVLSETLRELFNRSKLAPNVRLGVANQRTVLRMLELPPVTDRKELAAAVRFQAEDQVPMPLNNAVLDFQPLGVVETSGGPRQRVVLVAAQRDMVERLLTAVRSAGLRPEGVDLSAFALVRALYRPEHSADGRVLYLNVGGLTNMAIAEAKTCQFTRVISGGLEAMAIEVAERRQMSLEQARELLHSTSLVHEVSPAPTPQPEQVAPEPITEASEHSSEPGQDFGLGRPPEAQESTPGVDVPQAVNPSEATTGDVVERSSVDPHTTTQTDDELADVRMVLENGVREIAGEVRNSLDFHRTQDGGGTVSAVVLSGAALEIGGFADALQSDLGIAVHSGTVGVVSHDSMAGVSPQRLAIAAGLAAEEISS